MRPEDDRPEVLIVGAGPAGSALAGLLAALGRDVVVVDRARFPRAKACGECLSPGGVAAAGRLGLLDAVLRTSPLPLAGWSIRTPEGREARGTFAPGETALGIRRSSFDLALLEEARRRGARVREGWRATGIAPGDGPTVRLVPTGSSGPGRTIRPRLLVGADGLRSVVARAAGAAAPSSGRVKASLSWRLLGPPPERPCGRLYVGGPFTAGLAPVGPPNGDTPWVLTAVLDPSLHGALLRGPDGDLRREALRRVLGGLPGPSPDAFRAADRPLGSGPFDRPVRWIARGEVLLVGDAAGYFDPLTGQGIYRALRSAELAAPLIDRALASPRLSEGLGRTGRPLTRYARAVRREFRAGRTLQRALDAVLERPRVRDRAVGLLEGRSDRVRGLIRVTGDVAPARSLLQPGLWLGPGPPPEPGRAGPRDLRSSSSESRCAPSTKP